MVEVEEGADESERQGGRDGWLLWSRSLSSVPGARPRGAAASQHQRAKNLQVLHLRPNSYHGYRTTLTCSYVSTLIQYYVTALLHYYVTMSLHYHVTK